MPKQSDAESTFSLPPLDEISKLTADDLEAFFTARKVGDSCPFCATNTWVLLDTTVSGYVSMQTVTPKKETGMSPALLLSCANCAFVRLINSVTVANWKLGEAKRKNGSD